MNRALIAVAAIILIICAVVVVRRWLFWRGCISVEEARARVGQEVTVCYFVNSVSATTEGTVLNSSDEPAELPSLDTLTGFVTFIPPSVRLGGHPTMYWNRLIRVRGRIELHGDALRITVNDASQITR